MQIPVSRPRSGATDFGQQTAETRLDDTNRFVGADFLAAKAGNTLCVIYDHLSVLFADRRRWTMVQTVPAPRAVGLIDRGFGYEEMFE